MNADTMFAQGFQGVGARDPFLSLNEMVVPSSDVLSLENMPTPVRTFLDRMASELFDFEPQKIMVEGQSLSGKTFMIRQLIAHRDFYLAKSKTNSMRFFYLGPSELRAIQESPQVLQKEFAALVDFLGVDTSEICLVTSMETGFFVGAVLPGVNVIMEADENIVRKAQSDSVHTGAFLLKDWNHHSTASIVCKKDDLITLMMNTVVRQINDKTNASFTREHVESIMNLWSEELFYDEGMSAAPPGIWATTIRLVANSITYVSDPDLSDESGRVVFEKHVDSVMNMNDTIFLPYIISTSSPSDEILSDLAERLGKVFDPTQQHGGPGMGVVSAPEPRRAAGNANTKKLTFSPITDVRSELKSNIFGQESAIDQVIDSLTIPAANLHNPDRPLRSFLFAGPTGVGKTELALSLARSLGESEIPVIRIDMSEYQQPHEVAKLFGAPPGYMGFEQGGHLTSKVLENPVSVVLLDEVEKASPKVWETFLQVLDTGRMTDNQGREVDFRQTVVIMTSNIGAKEAQRNKAGFTTLGSAADLAKDEQAIISSALRSAFAPEFINRIDEIVHFSPLMKDMAAKIVVREIDKVVSRLKGNGFKVSSVPSEIVDFLVDSADIGRYGAREVQRIVNRKLANPLAIHVVHNPDEKNIELSLHGGELVVDNSPCDDHQTEKR